MNKSVLVVDDDENIRDIIKLFLETDKLEVYEAACGCDALEIFKEKKIDLIILDVLLGDINGFNICRKIRESSNLPILFLSALSDEDYFLLGYRVGADDYIAKPFNGSILAAKVHRMLEKHSQNINDKNTLDDKYIIIDELSHECFVDSEKIVLTPKEFNLLLELINNKGRVLTRDYLLHKIWDYDFIGDSRVVDNHIKKIRKKLGVRANMIKTVVSLGYKFEGEQ